MACGIPGIDENRVLDLYEGDYEIYLPVLRAYIDELPGSLARLRAVSAETLPDYARVMHGVKGTSASACAEEARKTAERLQLMAKAGDLAGVLSQNETFLNYMNNLSARIRNWFAENAR